MQRAQEVFRREFAFGSASNPPRAAALQKRTALGMTLTGKPEQIEHAPTTQGHASLGILSGLIQPFLPLQHGRKTSDRTTGSATAQLSEGTPESLSLADRIEQMRRALNAEEVAEILNVSKVTIFKQAKAGRIPSFRIGTCVRFDPKAVARWLRMM
jgi:excisionase family DNA binding protein